MNDAEQLGVRVTQLEELLTHMQRTVQDLHDVILDQNKRIDVLERHVQERTQELEATNKELTSANRDLEDFTASAAHDLRAPLNAMAGNCGLLREMLEQLPGPAGEPRRAGAFQSMAVCGSPGRYSRNCRISAPAP